MNEVWKDIKGYEGYYQVSNNGRVKSLGRYEEYLVKGNPVKRFRTEKIMKSKLNRGGYLCHHFRGETGSWPTLHRLVAEAFIPNPDNKPTINHKDGNKLNNSLNNLEWNTMSENTQHAYNLGLAKSKIKEYTKRCEENPNTILRNIDILKIKAKREKGQTLKSISEEFGVGISTIHRICNNISWRTLNAR